MLRPTFRRRMQTAQNVRKISIADYAASDEEAKQTMDFWKAKCDTDE